MAKVAVDDISAFYLPHFTFFMSFKMFLARFACHTAKRKKKKKKTNKKITKWTKKIKNLRKKKFWQWNLKKNSVDSVGAYGLNQSVQKQ